MKHDDKNDTGCFTRDSISQLATTTLLSNTIVDQNRKKYEAEATQPTALMVKRFVLPSRYNGS